MATKRRRRTRESRAVSDAVWCLLETGRSPDKGRFDTFWDAFFLEIGSPVDRRDAWESVKQQLLDDWIEAHPGTRPYAWWEFDAPTPRIGRDTARPAAQARYLKRHGLLTPGEGW